MAGFSGKHIEQMIGEELCRIVEAGLTDKKRLEFIEAILKHNGYDVRWQEDAKKNVEDPTTYSIGVTDLTFNPVLAIFGRRLRNLDGKRINAAYWNQKNENFDPNYWNEDPS